MSIQLDSMLDKKATITGVAGNARMGAVVLTDDRTPIYIDGLESWADTDLAGQQVEVSGTLRSRSLAPQATVDADGAVSHGMDGASSYVLENASWKAA